MFLASPHPRPPHRGCTMSRTPSTSFVTAPLAVGSSGDARIHVALGLDGDEISLVAGPHGLPPPTHLQPMTSTLALVSRPGAQHSPLVAMSSARPGACSAHHKSTRPPWDQAKETSIELFPTPQERAIAVRSGGFGSRCSGIGPWGCAVRLGGAASSRWVSGGRQTLRGVVKGVITFPPPSPLSKRPG